MKTSIVELGKYIGYVTEDDTDLVSVEYEVAWDPGTTTRRATWESLKELGLISEGSFPSHAVIVEAMIKLFKEEFPFFENFAADGGGIEANIPPMCMSLHKSKDVQKVLQKYMNYLEYYGFSDQSISAGIHLNVDYSLLGKNRIEYANTLKNLCQFSYENIDFMVKMSGRKRNAQILSDMYHFLGDVYALKDPKQNLEEFLIHKNLLADHFISDNTSSHLSLFNLHIGKDGRNALEIRWFGTTLCLREYYEILEFGVGLVYYCRYSDISDLSVDKFVMFLEETPSKYDNILNKISSSKKPKYAHNTRNIRES